MGRILTPPPFSPSPPPREERAGVRRHQCLQIKSPLPVWAGRGSRGRCQDAPGQMRLGTSLLTRARPISLEGVSRFERHRRFREIPVRDVGICLPPPILSNCWHIKWLLYLNYEQISKSKLCKPRNKVMTSERSVPMPCDKRPKLR